MKVAELFGFLTSPDRIRVIREEDKKELYVGYLSILTLHFDKDPEKAALCKSIQEADVKKYRTELEIRHKQWKEKGLMAPLEPEELPQYSFSDLQLSLYHTIYI